MSRPHVYKTLKNIYSLKNFLGIYKIESPSGRVYIGQTYNMYARYYSYKYNKVNHILRNSFNKYGFEAHTFTAIHEMPKDVSQDDMDRAEILYISQYKGCGYRIMNVRVGGDGGGLHSDETKQKLAERSHGNKNMLGKTHSEATKMLMSNSQKIRYATTENKNIGSRRSEESKRKISLARRGIKASNEAIQKLRQRMIGNTYTRGTRLTAEHRKKISLSGLAAKKGKPITQYDLSNNIIQDWDSATVAGRTLGLNRKNINKNLLGNRKQAFGYIWKFKTEA